jgi:hypothetical protein
MTIATPLLASGNVGLSPESPVAGSGVGTINNGRRQ